MTPGTSLVQEHDFEPEPGLPEPLPRDETLLWQGAPDWRALAIRAFHVRKLALYFGALIAIHAVVSTQGGQSAADTLRGLAIPLALAGAGLGLVSLLAWLSARSTLYTLTDRRVVMRIGIVLTITFNLPLKRIVSADLRATPRGTADIALRLDDGSPGIAWLTLWPHARPWHIGRAQPMLRCVPEGERIATLLTRCWAAHHGAPAVTRPVAATNDGTALAGRPALAPQ
jgi:hypothetical protein